MERGIFGPLIVDLVTPFREGRVDHSALRILVSRQIDAGVSSVVVCSAAGEAPCLNRAERGQTIRFAVEAAAKRVPIIAGVCANSTQEAMGMCHEAALAGAAGLLVTVPFYNKPGERGIHAHFAAISAQVRLPILIDNAPSRTGTDLSETLASNLLALDNVAGLVEESCDLVRLASRRFTSPDVPIFTREDTGIVGFLAAGGTGCLSTFANLIPGALSNVVGLSSAGKCEAARAAAQEIYALLRSMGYDQSPANVKHLLKNLVAISDEVRLPTCAAGAVDRDAHSRLASKLAQLEVAAAPYITIVSAQQND